VWGPAVWCAIRSPAWKRQTPSAAEETGSKWIAVHTAGPLGDPGLRCYSGLKTAPRTIIAAGENAAVEWEYNGTHQVVDERGVADALGLMQQLGVFD
jgi:hypothetical protein